MRSLVSLLFVVCVVSPVLAAGDQSGSEAAESPRATAEPPATSPPFQLAQSTSCSTDCDCSPGLSCYMGSCFALPPFGPQNPNPECNYGCPSHCPAGQSCNYSHECISTGCTSDCQCQPGYYCTPSGCLPGPGPFPQCNCSNQCPPGSSCVLGRCEILNL